MTVWDPPPRKPRLLLFALSLLIVIATTAYGVWWVRDFIGIRYEARPDGCASIDLGPVAAVLGPAVALDQKYEPDAGGGARQLTCNFRMPGPTEDTPRGAAIVVLEWYGNAPAAELSHGQHRAAQSDGILDETIVRDVPDAGQEAFGSHDPGNSLLRFQVQARDHNLIVGIEVALPASIDGWDRRVCEAPFRTLGAAAQASFAKLG
ncbi:hypothetical protein [Actinoplanes sp. RD1]|uniref:hypothetical protein n=1 Tax=Actinoplanes sp. RD1 TaxID=3064538 RepID=UPI002742166B|nr:hypothetical protein [Actinoplanes sp. RD1]